MAWQLRYLYLATPCHIRLGPLIQREKRKQRNLNRLALHSQIDVVAAHCDSWFPGRMVWHSIIPFPAQNCGRAANLIPNLHRITIYGASIHPASLFILSLAQSWHVLTVPWRSWPWSTDPTTVEAYCRYEHLHDPPRSSGSNASPHQWPYCPLRLLANLLTIETRYKNSILDGNGRNQMRKFFFFSTSRLSLSRARVRKMKLPDKPFYWCVLEGWLAYCESMVQPSYCMALLGLLHTCFWNKHDYLLLIAALL